MRRSLRLRLLGPRTRNPWAARLLRAALLIGLVLVFRWRFQTEEEAGITVSEVRALLPEAVRLQPDTSARGGEQVFDEFGLGIGYAVRTLPAARPVIGYAGPTDTLVVFDQRGVIAGLRIRGSADTVNHVQDVKDDDQFMALLTGLTWEQAAAFDPSGSPVDAVSGATLTSRAMMEGVTRRLRLQPVPLAWRWGLRDVIAAVVVLGGLLLAFTRQRVRPAFRVGFAAATVLALGFVSGDFVTQSVMLGWAQGAVPLRTAPGLVLLCAVAFAVPWATGRAVYCQQICPYGLLQDLVARLSPWRWRVRADARRALHWAPRALLLVAIGWALLEMPIELAQLEPFDAYLLSAGAGLSIVWAVGGLIAAIFVPRAYCRFGCPTGALLDLARARPTSR